jgi:hypothetical protein
VNAPSKIIHIVIGLLVILGMPWSAVCGENPKSNERIMVDLSRDAAGAFCADLKVSDTISVAIIIDNGETNRFFGGPLLEWFRQHFGSVYARSGAASIDVAVSVPDVAVSYGESFSDGFFSARKSLRVVDVAVRLTATRAADGKVLSAGTERRSFSDTVYVDEISQLQESSKRIASGPLPDRTALERFFGPLIIAGAAGIAVYLFFTSRS